MGISTCCKHLLIYIPTIALFQFCHSLASTPMLWWASPACLTLTRFN